MKALLPLGLAFSVLLAGATSAQATRPSAAPQELRDYRAELGRIIERIERQQKSDANTFLELRQLLIDAPEIVDGIPALLRAGDVDTNASSVLIYALEDLGDREAQQALVSIHGDTAQRHDDRLRAAISLGSVPRATPEALSSLRAAAGDWDDVDLANTSLLSLGRAGYRLRAAGHMEDYAGVRDDLLLRLRRSTLVPERVMALQALANLHDESVGGELSNYLVDESASVRAAAAQALGALGDPQHRDVLIALLPMERLGAVRAYMAAALRGMPADRQSLAAVHALVVSERDNEARAQMVRYLVAHLREYWEARPTLLDMTANDPENQIRLLASAVLRIEPGAPSARQAR